MRLAARNPINFLEYTPDLFSVTKLTQSGISPLARRLLDTWSMVQVQALAAEAGALPTVLQCLALHSTSRGITDSAVTVARALLAAAHASGWATTGSQGSQKVKSHSAAERGLGVGTAGVGGGCIPTLFKCNAGVQSFVTRTNDLTRHHGQSGCIPPSNAGIPGKRR